MRSRVEERLIKLETQQASDNTDLRLLRLKVEILEERLDQANDRLRKLEMGLIKQQTGLEVLAVKQEAGREADQAKGLAAAVILFIVLRIFSALSSGLVT